ncbi:MAG: SLC13 family permease [Ginsengibacter sp.]
MVSLSQEWQQIIVITVTVLLIFFLFWEKVKPSFVFFAAVFIFLITGIVDTKGFLNSLANESILSIFLLIFITAGLRNHFNIIGWLDKLFGKTSNPRSFMFRMTAGVTAMSAFLNNTPIVALLMPYVYQWAKKHKISPGKFLIPLSYAAIIGGMITVIGTSTNLVLNGLIESKNGVPLGLFDYLYPGLLVSIAGIIFLYLFGLKLLPNRKDLLESNAKLSREYLVETRVTPGSSLIGKSVIDANLRNLTGIYLFEIARNGNIITPVNPDEIIQSNDALFFAGETQNIMELLERDNELSLPMPGGQEVDHKHNIIETVIPINSELAGKTLKQLEFRENYDAAVVAIHRNGAKLRGKIGEIEMQAGDLLMISAGKNFRQQLNARPNLYLVSVLTHVEDAKPLVKSGFAVILIVVITGMVLGYLNLFLALMIITAYMVVGQLLTISEIKKQLDMDLLMILVASLTFSKAIIDSGTAELISHNFISLFSGFGNKGILIGLYLITLVLTTFITHVAAVSIIFPIAFSLGTTIPGMNMTALLLAISFAASASFHSPFSYQTNLMVYGPGGYKFKDFVKIGLPFTFIYSIIVLFFLILYYNI